MPKAAKPRAAKPTGKTRHDPLHVQLGEDEVEAKYGKLSRPGKRRKSKIEDESEDTGGVRNHAARPVKLLTTCSIGHTRSQDIKKDL